MATAKEIKARLRANVEQRMRDVPGDNSCFYQHIAYGALWAAYVAEAISQEEQHAYLKQLNWPGYTTTPAAEVAHG